MESMTYTQKLACRPVLFNWDSVEPKGCASICQGPGVLLLADLLSNDWSYERNKKSVFFIESK